MEAARAGATRELTGERAQRIIDAMRASVARRGAAGSTFDHVAREAGVSRGLLHYYFGTKERLLVEVVRRDSDIRMEALDRSLADAHTADEFIDVLVRQLEDLVADDRASSRCTSSCSRSARRNADIAAEMAELHRRTRAHVAQLLADKQREGVLQLHDEPEAIATCCSRSPTGSRCGC